MSELARYSPPRLAGAVRFARDEAPMTAVITLKRTKRDHHHHDGACIVDGRASDRTLLETMRLGPRTHTPWRPGGGQIFSVADLDPRA